MLKLQRMSCVREEQELIQDIHAGRAHVANQINKCGHNWGSVMLGEPGRDFFR